MPTNRPMAPLLSNESQSCFDGWCENRILSYRQAAVYIGGFCESLLESLLEARRCRTLAYHFCPDLVKGNLLIESKGMRYRGETLLRVEQMEKYDNVTDREVIYCFVIHKVKAKTIPHTSVLYKQMAKSIDAVYVVDSSLVHSIRDTRRIETKNRLYAPFVRCRHTDLEKWFKVHGVGTTYGVDVTANGEDVEPFPVHLMTKHYSRLAHICKEGAAE